MALSPPPTSEAGIATPAALVLALLMALICVAMVQRSTALLVLARSDLDDRTIEYGLAGAQLQAAATIVRSGLPGPFHWASSTDQGFVDVRAEREGDKLSLTSGAGLAPQMLGLFGVVDASALAGRLQAAANGAAVDVGGLDQAPLWQLCAARALSSFGQQTAYLYVADTQPLVGNHPAVWHVGETWRIRATTAEGWRDERIVRFTGDARNPAAIVLRTFAKGEIEGGQCDSILQAVGAA